MSENTLKMLSDIRIKDADAADITSLIEIANNAGLSPWTPANYLDEMKRNDSVIKKAVDNENVVLGFICGRIPREGVDEAEIFNIAVRSPGKGIGSALIDSFISKCRRRKIRKVWLDVRSSNSNAISFYRGKGFSVVGRRRGFYSDPAEDALLMSRIVEIGEA
jgi:ribosomal-protein-alanine N-acetyltransferase